MSNIYTYVDSTGFLVEVFESDLNFAGGWSPAADYYRNDVVDYNFTRYICIAPHSNSPPPFDLQFNGYWSIIAFTSTGSGFSGTFSDAAIAELAGLPGRLTEVYNIAVAGTDAAAQAYSIAVLALNTAWAGTDVAQAAQQAADSAYALALYALHTAWAGTASGTGSGSSFDVNTILTTLDGNVVVNSSGNVVTSGP